MFHKIQLGNGVFELRPDQGKQEMSLTKFRSRRCEIYHFKS